MEASFNFGDLNRLNMISPYAQYSFIRESVFQYFAVIAWCHCAEPDINQSLYTFLILPCEGTCIQKILYPLVCHEVPLTGLPVQCNRLIFFSLTRSKKQVYQIQILFKIVYLWGSGFSHLYS